MLIQKELIKYVPDHNNHLPPASKIFSDQLLIPAI
jgi:hypothetical protein